MNYLEEKEHKKCHEGKTQQVERRRKVRGKFVLLRSICKRFSFEYQITEIVPKGFFLRMLIVPNHMQMIFLSRVNFSEHLRRNFVLDRQNSDFEDLRLSD